MKICKKCNKNKQLDEFYKQKTNKDGRFGCCKECSKKRSLAWKKANPDKARVHNVKWKKNNSNKIKIYHNKWYEKNLSKIRNRILKRDYGITLEQYYSIFQKQSSCCAICNRSQSEFEKVLCVDHNHKTGEVRGLLCDLCNKAIGLFQDQIDRLRNAIKYLEKI